MANDPSHRVSLVGDSMQRLVFIAVMLVSLIQLACRFDQPRIAIESTNLDLGSVINGEIVSHELAVRNDGNAELIIDSIATSCSCTSATINPMKIGAGQSGTLHIEFDSGYHGSDLTGPLIRQVFLGSNDPEQPELIVELVINVEARSTSAG